MKIKDQPLNERGIAHLGLILLLLVIIGAGYFAYTRVSSADDNKAKSGTSTSTSADTNTDEDAKDAAAIDKAEKDAQDVPTTTTEEAPNVTE